MNVVVLGEIIGRLGVQYSRLSPKWSMFLSSSFSLLLQLIRVPLFIQVRIYGERSAGERKSTEVR